MVGQKQTFQQSISLVDCMLTDTIFTHTDGRKRLFVMFSLIRWDLIQTWIKKHLIGYWHNHWSYSYFSSHNKMDRQETAVISIALKVYHATAVLAQLGTGSERGKLSQSSWLGTWARTKSSKIWAPTGQRCLIPSLTHTSNSSTGLQLEIPW